MFLTKRCFCALSWGLQDCNDAARTGRSYYTSDSWNWWKTIRLQ